MSRTATATPPPAFFPARNATPTMRHCSAPNVNASHFTPRHQPHNTPNGKRRTKRLSTTFGVLKSGSYKRTQAEELSTSKDDQMEVDQSSKSKSAGIRPGMERSVSDFSVYSTSSRASFTAVKSDDLDEEALEVDNDYEGRALTPTPSEASTAPSTSLIITPLATPSSSRASSLLQGDDTSSGLGLSLDTQTPRRPSWNLQIPGFGNFGKIAKAVAISFGEKRVKAKETAFVPVPIQPPAPVPDVVYLPSGYAPRPNVQEMRAAGLSDEQIVERNREWVIAEQRKFTECARLCSQWPQSAYNTSKFGPHGSKSYYEPQCYAKTEHVASIMQKQAEMERRYASRADNFFSALGYPRSRRRSPSEEDSDSSTNVSERSSPATSMHLSVEDRREAAIRDAMRSSLISSGCDEGDAELDVMAKSMGLGMDDMAMDVDAEASRVVNRPCSAQSCGAKRPLVIQGAEDAEEDKRRKVDEAMVVEEAVQTGVIVPPTAQDPNSNPGSDGAMFGHVIKTSDTHPIIISPLFPPELLPVLSQNLVIPTSGNATYKSTLDIPSLLFSPVQVPSPLLGSLRAQQGQIQGSGGGVKLGNLLLSSCPGKRLRLEGPCKGRGPVCRDLKTDLKRIRGEGVGLLVCCLDDSELELLGVPWESYREAAAECGLDILRLPMPDGFTPSSVSHFDTQINLITSRYTLRGIHTLVHCRGGIGRAGLTACAWAIKMGFASPHPSLLLNSQDQGQGKQGEREREHQMIMSTVERVVAMIRCRRGMKAIESFEQVGFLVCYVRWLRERERGC